MDRGKWGWLIWCVYVWQVGVGVDCMSVWCVCVCVKLTLFWYSCYYHTWALLPLLPPLTHTLRRLFHPDDAVRYKATAGSGGILMTHNAVHWARKCLLSQGGPLTVANVTHHCHLAWPRGATVVVAWCIFDTRVNGTGCPLQSKRFLSRYTLCWHNWSWSLNKMCLNKIFGSFTTSYLDKLICDSKGCQFHKGQLSWSIKLQWVMELSWKYLIIIWTALSSFLITTTNTNIRLKSAPSG